MNIKSWAVKRKFTLVWVMQSILIVLLLGYALMKHEEADGHRIRADQHQAQVRQLLSDIAADYTRDRLSGKWVEITSLSDTIDFDRTPGNLTLIRANEIRADKLKPKHGQGYYRYKISGNMIWLNWMFSSVKPTAYKFEQRGDTLLIENFYDMDSRGMMQAFKKI
jgi:hypothetical protein